VPSVTTGNADPSFNLRDWATRLVLAGGVAAAIAAVGYWLVDGDDAAHERRLRTQLAEQRAEALAIAEQNQRLAREIDALKTEPRAVEDIARDELGLVYPGEIVIRVEGLSAPAPASAAALPTPGSPSASSPPADSPSAGSPSASSPAAPPTAPAIAAPLTGTPASAPAAPAPSPGAEAGR
jgi:cell division protein FtsB